MSNLTDVEILALFKDAPEGCTHYDSYSESHLRITNNECDYYGGRGKWYSMISCSEKIDKLFPFIKRPETTTQETNDMSKYEVAITNKHGESMNVDAYDIIEACQVTCPALQHAAKKVLFPGKRGHKDTLTDLMDIISSSERAYQLEVMRNKS